MGATTLGRPLLLRFLSRSDGPLSPGSIISWWELRRAAYNAIVGIVGLPWMLLSMLLAFHCGAVDWMDRAKAEPVLGMLVSVASFGIAANLCFTAGWVLEVLVARLFKVDTHRFGPMALMLGTLISAVVTTAVGLTAGVLSARYWCES